MMIDFTRPHTHMKKKHERDVAEKETLIQRDRKVPRLAVKKFLPNLVHLAWIII